MVNSAVLPATSFALVVVRELEREHLALAGLQAERGFLEFGQHAALAQHEQEVLGLAAFEGHAVDRAGKVQHDAVAVLRGAAFAGFELGALLCAARRASG